MQQIVRECFGIDINQMYQTCVCYTHAILVENRPVDHSEGLMSLRVCMNATIFLLFQ